MGNVNVTNVNTYFYAMFGLKLWNTDRSVVCSESSHTDLYNYHNLRHIKDKRTKSFFLFSLMKETILPPLVIK